jgi:hypothetical protein
MLTLKILHTDNEGGKTTYLFAGERISHTEVEQTNHSMEFKTLEENDYFLVGEFANELSKQPYVMSTVNIFDGNDYQTIQILPKSECFVMSNGKTVDTFSAYYK